MMRIALLTVALLLALPAQAKVVATPKDKIGHLILGGVAYGGCRILGYQPETCLYTAMGVGAAKEAYDYMHPHDHSAEMMDFSATATGGLLLFTFERAF
jgi:hypothetical protein